MNKKQDPANSHKKREPVNAAADAFRRWGYLQAEIDPLARLEPFCHPDITDVENASAQDIVDRWRSIYCGPIGVEFMHMIERDRCAWVTKWMESDHEMPLPREILLRLMMAELFERFLHKRYVGSKRYSIEGVAGLIPLIESVLDAFARQGGESAIIAMSHRGRLNVLANIVDIPGDDVFAGQEDVDPKSVLGGGDVKYHLGATGVHTTSSGLRLRIHLVSNPSHLEAAAPVAMGRTRAKQDRRGRTGREKVLCITIHGDAAFAGQGVTAETLNLATLPGFEVGGTIRLIANNLIGFTAEFPQLHSSRYASDTAKRLSIPILHVNGEVPEAILRSGRMAVEYRSTFSDDVVVDLIGYRRYGHSEVEDPSTTQPLLYAQIENRPMLWQIYAERIGADKKWLERKEKHIWEQLSHEQELGRSQKARPRMHQMPDYWDDYEGGRYKPEYEVETQVERSRLVEIGERITDFPPDLSVHPKVRRGYEMKLKMVKGEQLVDWGTAETLAIGALLWQGTRVRFAGEDSRRGTFNQRHAVIIDTKNGEVHTPLSHLHPEQGEFTVLDTPLSEMAALGFEYGYSRDYPDALVCWEAQFGDFANGAQTIIDQFVCAGEDKWRLLSGLVMLLPHGFEGQGPEHSSARLERFLQLAAEDNIQICQPSSAAQYFHLLRRQSLRTWRKPMVVMTPKSLLRAQVASSSIDELANGRFEVVFPDREAASAERLLICSGKIVHELRAERTKRQDNRTAIVSFEQLYPFPKMEFEAELQRHGNVRKIVWVQEEPANMGALAFMRNNLRRVVGDRHVTTVKRSESASPATGSPKAHKLEQQALVRLAFS